MDPLIQVLLTLVVGLGGAYLGAKWGAEHALERFRRERGHADRAEWYKSTIEALREASMACVEVSNHLEEEAGDEEVKAARKRAGDALDLAFSKVEWGRTYAEKDDFKHLEHLFVSFLEAFHDRDEKEAWDEISGVLTEAYSGLMVQARNHGGFSDEGKRFSFSPTSSSVQ